MTMNATRFWKNTFSSSKTRSHKKGIYIFTAVKFSMGTISNLICKMLHPNTYLGEVCNIYNKIIAINAMSIKHLRYSKYCLLRCY